MNSVPDIHFLKSETFYQWEEGLQLKRALLKMFLRIGTKKASILFISIKSRQPLLMALNVSSFLDLFVWGSAHDAATDNWKYLGTILGRFTPDAKTKVSSAKASTSIPRLLLASIRVKTSQSLVFPPN